MKITDKELMVKMRDVDKLEFRQIAERFGCTKQGVHNCYYRAKAKELLPIEFDYGEVYGGGRLSKVVKTMHELSKELRARGETLAKCVNNEIEKRFIGGGK